MATTPKPTDCSAEVAPHNISKKYDDIVEQLQNTLVIGDYEELFFKVLLELKFSPNDLEMVEKCYESLIEDIYGG